MIGMHVRSRQRIMHMGTGSASIVSHRFVVVVVVVLCRGRQWRAQGHRCGSEALERHRQQRHPDDQDFEDGFHAKILAQPKEWEIPRL